MRLQISPVIPTDHAQGSEDPLNLEHRLWHNPWEPEQCFHSSVPEMMKKASGRYQKAFRYLNQLYTAHSYEDRYDAVLEQLCQFLGSKSFHSGLDWILGE